MTQNKLPHLVTIGAQKAGTTWLQHVLECHSRVYYPPGMGEIHFFDAEPPKSLKYYSDLYADVDEVMVTCDVTPAYLAHPDAPYRAKQAESYMDREFRFIVICREPVDRILSAYQMSLRKGKTHSLAEAVATDPRLVQKGLYATHLKQWFAHFPRNRFLIETYDDVFCDPQSFLKRIQKHLNLSVPLQNVYNGQRVNAGGIPRFKSIDIWSKRTGMFLRRSHLMRLLHTIKRTWLIKYIYFFNRKAYVLSESDKFAMAALRERFNGEVNELAEIIDRPDVVERWGYVKVESRVEKSEK